jgi:Transposase DDE domain
MGCSRGINFMDFTPIRVCHIKREKQHRVMDGFATKGKSTMGWFYGFKLHLIINDKGGILSFYLTQAIVDDRNIKVIKSLTENIFGSIYADRGYISKILSELLWNDGIHLVYKRRSNMKSQNLSDTDKLLLRKRALIECVNDELKNICAVEHSRHRAVKGFIINLISGLVAYQFLPKKPSLKIQPYKNESNQLLLFAA